MLSIQVFKTPVILSAVCYRLLLCLSSEMLHWAVTKQEMEEGVGWVGGLFVGSVRLVIHVLHDLFMFEMNWM